MIYTICIDHFDLRREIMPKGIKGSGKPRGNKTISGEHAVFEHKENKEPIALSATYTKPLNDWELQEEIEEKIRDIKKEKESLIKNILLSIVDALYDKDGDAATWKPIRDKIEAL
jgi:hypothetical protein